MNQTSTLPPPALELRGVRRVFRQGGVELNVLNGVDLVLNPGEIGRASCRERVFEAV